MWLCKPLDADVQILIARGTVRGVLRGIILGMDSNPNPPNSLAWGLWFLGEIAFKWVPGAVMTVAGTGVPGEGGPSPINAPITHAVSAPEVVQYLQTASAPGAYDQLYHNWTTFVAFSLLICLCLSALCIYCSIRVFQIRQLERRKFAAAQRTVAAHDVPKTHLRWNRVLEQARGDSAQGWRLAILEADIMLNELLDTLGYRGETMADKMRNVDRVNFHTIDLAWEAHKIRNKIAHEGETHELSSREARRVIALYERVFREFRFIE